MAEILIAFLTPIASYAGKWVVNKIKNRKDQKEISIDVISPEYNGTANHWVSFLFERIEEEKGQDLKYAYIGNEFQTSVEKDTDVSTIKMQVPSVDHEAMKELMINNLWNNKNDEIHGNGVFNFALPQIVHADFKGDSYLVQYQDLSSIPLNGKYMFSTKLKPTNFKKQDPGDFYRSGGLFEIPIYVEKQSTDYQVYPVTPPPPKIPDYAIRTKVMKGDNDLLDIENPVFAFCPYCGAKMPKTQDLKFCLSCGKNIQKHLTF